MCVCIGSHQSVFKYSSNLLTAASQDWHQDESLFITEPGRISPPRPFLFVHLLSVKDLRLDDWTLEVQIIATSWESDILT